MPGREIAVVVGDEDFHANDSTVRNELNSLIHRVSTGVRFVLAVAFCFRNAAFAAGLALSRRDRGAEGAKDRCGKGLNIVRWRLDPRDERRAAEAPGRRGGARVERGRGDRGLFLRPRDLGGRLLGASRGSCACKSSPASARASQTSRSASAARRHRRRGAPDARAGARGLDAAARAALPPGRLGSGQAAGGARRCPAGATPRRDIADSQARHRPGDATRPRWRSRWRAARRFASASCASAARSATREADRREPGAGHAGRNLRSRQGDRSISGGCSSRAISRACRPRSTRSRRLADAAPLRVAVIEAPKHHFESGVGYNTDVGPRLEARYTQPGYLLQRLALRLAAQPRREDPEPDGSTSTRRRARAGSGTASSPAPRSRTSRTS